MLKNVIQGVVWILKRLLSSFKDTHQAKNNEERERREKERSLRQPVQETKKEKETRNKGQSVFLGQKCGQTNPKINLKNKK
jgi:hypothetical protein